MTSSKSSAYEIQALNKSLAAAVRFMDFAGVKGDLARGASPNTKEVMASLHSTLGNTDNGDDDEVTRANAVLSLLLEAGMDPNQKITTTASFFNWICANYHKSGAEIVIEKTKIDLDLLSVDRHGDTLLVSRCKSIRLSGLKALQGHFEQRILPKNPGLASNHLWTLKDEDEKGIHMLCIVQPAKFRWLMSHPYLGFQERIEDKDINGRSALRIAVALMSYEAVSTLLSMGASLESVDKNGTTVLEATLGMTVSDANQAAMSAVKSAILAAQSSRLAMSSIDAALSCAGVQPSRSAP